MAEALLATSIGKKYSARGSARNFNQKKVFGEGLDDNFNQEKVFGEGLAEYFYLEKCASNEQIHWAYCLWETGKGSALRG